MKKITSILLFSFFSLLAFTSCKKDDPCESTLCLNEAICEDGSCKCATGYEGETCNTEMRSKFMGLWDFNTSCVTGEPENQPITITTGVSIQDVFIYIEGDLLIYCTVDGNTINIESQDVGSIISGSGSIDENNTCTINMQIIDGSDIHNCVWTMTK